MIFILCLLGTFIFTYSLINKDGYRSFSCGFGSEGETVENIGGSLCLTTKNNIASISDGSKTQQITSLTDLCKKCQDSKKCPKHKPKEYEFNFRKSGQISPENQLTKNECIQYAKDNNKLWFFTEWINEGTPENPKWKKNLSAIRHGVNNKYMEAGNKMYLYSDNETRELDGKYDKKYPKGCIKLVDSSNAEFMSFNSWEGATSNCSSTFQCLNKIEKPQLSS